MTAIGLEAAAPAPVRDEVKLMVAQPGRPLVHTRFRDLPTHLRAGDLLIVNASATIPAALPARRPDGERVDLHLSTPHPDGRYVVEVRRHGGRAKGRREMLTLPAGATATLEAPYLGGRLWIATLELPTELLAYLDAHGAPIRYAHEPDPHPLEDHQTIFATEPGSAEMPSAGRPFTRRVLDDLRRHGISVQRITLHTGVSSLERGERPYPERYAVPRHTAARINARRGRLIAVGTTVVRTLATVTDEHGVVHPGAGWTNVVVTPERPPQIDGLLTGWHEPDASHLLLLEAIAGRALLERSYAAARDRGYRLHEFGDSHLILRQ